MADLILNKKKNKSQAILEVSVVFVLILVFILGIMRIWTWAHAQVVSRNVAYQNTRDGAGTVETRLADRVLADKEAIIKEIGQIMQELKDVISSGGDNISGTEALALSEFQGELSDFYNNYLDTEYAVPEGYLSEKTDMLINEARSIAKGLNPKSEGGEIIDASKQENLIKEISSNKDFKTLHQSSSNSDTYLSAPDIRNNADFLEDYVGQKPDETGQYENYLTKLNDPSAQDEVFSDYNSYDRIANSDNLYRQTDELLKKADQVIQTTKETHNSKIVGILKDFYDAMDRYSRVRKNISRQHGAQWWPVYQPVPLAEKWAIPESPLKKQ